MEGEIKAFGKEYSFIGNEGIVFAPEASQKEAVQNMKKLEETLSEIGFSCVFPRKVKWDSSRYVAVVDESGRFVTLDSYFKGEGKEARLRQSICYDVSGLKNDIEMVIAKIQENASNKGVEQGSFAYTCR